MVFRNLQKWHGAGNDFLVDVIEHGVAPWWSPERARAVCSRATGFGADGLLVATVGSHISMELYNADGSIAEMSGNGIRCLAAAVRRTTAATWDRVEIETGAGSRTVNLAMDGTSGSGSVDMGDVTFHEDIDGALGVADVGNPHVVVLDDPKWTARDCEALAEGLAAQLGGANVEFVTVVGPDHLSLRVIERGVGWTLACGTGSCASVAVSHRLGLTGPDVIVDNPGGTLRVTLGGARAQLSGPVQFVGNVEWLES
jgi:diaminopimelate epimerase